MSTRQPDKRTRRAAGASRRGAQARAVSATRALLVTIVQIVMLAILVGAVLWAVEILVTAVVRPGWLHFPALNAYVAFALAVATNVLLLVLALNATYLRDRLIAADRQGTMLLVVWACGAAAIIIGLVGTFGLGAYIAALVLPAAMAFVLIGLVSPGLFRRPLKDSAADGDGAAGSGERGRQRRGGRTRR